MRLYMYNTQSGYIALISVLVVGAVGMSITVSLLLLGVQSTNTTLVTQQHTYAKALADACAEEALQEIRDSTSFTGSGNITLGQGTCSYTVTDQGGQNRTVTASGEVGAITRKVEVIIDSINPTIEIVSWEEAADF